MSQVFYELDSTKVSNEEYRFGTSWLLMPLVWLIKLLRVRLPSSTDDPAVESLSPFRVAGETISPEILQKFREPAGKLSAFGFHSPTFYFIDDRRHLTKIAWVTWQHSSGQLWARQQYRHWSGASPAREHLFCTLVSGLADGGFLATSSGKPDLLSPPTIDMHRYVGSDVGLLLQSHQQRLRELPPGTAVLPVRNPEEIAKAEETFHGQTRDFHRQRGIFKSTEPVAEVFVPTSSGVEVVASGFRHSDVLVELTRLQNKRVGWGNMLIVLVVSIALFMLAGMQEHKLLTIGTLAGVIFFHELGHYVAMRFFGYRNLRMFFIPFLGAAVSGQNYNVPGWKKAIVSLMGPVPGIFLGLIAGVAGMVTDTQWLISLAAVSMALNGFNLLPILPLDGGWVLHATLFCRHPVLSVGFRFMASLALMLFGLLLGSIFFGIWGGLMLMGLPLVYRLAKVAGELQSQGVPTHSTDAQTVPAEAAVRIIDALEGIVPAQQRTPKMMAQHTLNIFETLNAHPPGWPVSLALLTIHGGSFLVACVMLPFLIMTQHANLGDIFSAAANRPSYAFTPGDTQVWRGPEGATANGVRVTVIGHYDDSAAAREAFGPWTKTLPPTARAAQIGNLVVVSVPRANEKTWHATEQGMNQQCGLVTVDEGDGRVAWRVLAIAPTTEVAEKMMKSMNDYWGANIDNPPAAPWKTGPPPADGKHAALESDGMVIHAGPILRIEELGLNHADETFPQLLDWLVREKCVDIRFEVSAWVE